MKQILFGLRFRY